MTEIRSYRKVFDLERRIYSIDRLRLNPAGIPVRGLVYFLAALALALVLAGMPILGVAIRLLPWYLRDLALPALAATAFGVVRIEGRTFHLTADALLRYLLTPRRLTCLSAGDGEKRWRPEELLMLPDGSDGRLREMRYLGPGTAIVRVEHERRGGPARISPGRSLTVSAGTVSVRELPAARWIERGRAITLGRGARLCVRAAEPGAARR